MHCADINRISITFDYCTLITNVTVTLRVGTASDPDIVRRHIDPLVIIIAFPLQDIGRTG